MPPTKVIRNSGTKLGKGPKLTVDFIDSGQGNAVLVTYPNGNYMLVDCGSQATSTTGWPFTHVQNYITSVTGGNAISCVVLSHGDDDHTAFIPHIAEATRPTYVHYGGSISEYSKEVQDWIAKQEGQKGQFVYKYKKDTCISQPDADFASETTPGEAWTMVLSASFGKSPNSKSIVLMIRFGEHTVILPGDADTTTETFILGKVPKKLLNRSTVLMPGHHGAFESTGAAWAKRLDPDVDVISASGTNKAYAHPSCATIKLLEEYCLAGALSHDVICSDGKGSDFKRSATVESVLTTATNGDVRFVSDGTNWKLMASSTSADELAQEQPHPLLRSMVTNAPWTRRPADRQLAVRVQGPVPGLGPLAEPEVHAAMPGAPNGSPSTPGP
ncbi:ComEC/Rec2 family competence protein [Streptomyces sp. NPDC051064]|uniref:ComEC/Rec2 family competence protein n=1 Tax=Streptomyces sp. NPDC051064 TaxID=3365641 RepID=UPI0037A539DB